LNRWTRLGRFFNVQGNLPWSSSHAQLPIVLMNEQGSGAEIFFSTRDSQNVSRGARIVCTDVLNSSTYVMDNQPILDIGKLGTFDDSGAMPTCAVNVDGDTYLYYIGWNARATVPYHNSLGLAIRKKGETEFVKISDGPLFDRTLSEPYFNGTAWVMRENGCWRMWYLSCTEWRMVGNKPEPRYLIRYAESQDGIDWKRDGHICIDYNNEDEAIAGASVVKLADQSYLMMFCHRSIINYRSQPEASYKIGFATSANRLNWQRSDEPIWENEQFEPWEQEMQAYPCLFNLNQRLMMMYNGNGFGREGFALASQIISHD